MAKDPVVTPTQAEIEEGLKLLGQKRAAEEKRKERIARGEIPAGVSYKDLPPDVKAKYQERDRRYAAKVKIMIRKAKEAGITVSEEEINTEVASK